MSEAAFLRGYRPEAFPRPSVAVDIVVLTIVDAELRVLLVRRDEHPFKHRWALPGGFLRVGAGPRDQGEDLDAAAGRELEEETGLPARSVFLEQLHTFGKAYRDPRMRVVSVAYYALVKPDRVALVRAGGDASFAGWFPARDLAALSVAFDHADMVELAITRIVERLDRSDVVFNLVPSTFTVPELRSVREILTGQPQDPGNFRRRFSRMVQDGLIERASGRRITASKPATVYRFRNRDGLR